MIKYFSIIILITLFAACTKNDPTAITFETYKIKGKLDVINTTIPTAVLTNATFTIAFNKADSISVLNGSMTISGYSGVTGKDSLLIFSARPPLIDTAYLTVTDSLIGTTNTTNTYSYYNGSIAKFSTANLSFFSFGTASILNKKMYIRMGKYPKYVFVLFDDVVKQ